MIFENLNDRNCDGKSHFNCFISTHHVYINHMLHLSIHFHVFIARFAWAFLIWLTWLLVGIDVSIAEWVSWFLLVSIAMLFSSKTWLVKVIDQRSLAGLCLAQHKPVTFFLQGNSRSHQVKTITAISTTFTFSAVWNSRLKAFGYFIWCKTHSDGRCLLVLGKTVIDRSYLSMVQFGTVNAALTTNRRLENFLTRVSLKYVLIFLMAVMCCPCSCQTYVSRLLLFLCLSRTLSRFNSAVFNGYKIKALWACCRTF